MANNVISERDKVKICNYIWEYEKSLSQTFGFHDVNNKKLKRFLSSCDIFLGRIRKKDINKAYKHSFYILYEQNKPYNRPNDEVHHLLRHIRNCFAHGHIVKQGIDKFHISDYKEQKKTMEGIINYKDLFTLIECLKKS